MGSEWMNTNMYANPDLLSALVLLNEAKSKQGESMDEPKVDVLFC